MKNIHVLPTDKPSRLWINNLLQGKLELSKEMLTGSNTAQNIYITSNEDIKEGVDQWYLDKVLNEPYNSGGAQYSSKQDVIILTTDQDLIKDGVQSIDDAFLEWFIKNPSCEEVEMELVALNKYGSEISVNSYGFEKFGYKIIIPKEEPEFIQINQDNPVTRGSTALVRNPKYQREMKQETLEEAAKKYSGIAYDRNDYEERYYNQQGCDKYDSFVEGAKWQQERMYSEEEVYELFAQWAAYQQGFPIVDEDEIPNGFMSFNQWFEQNKNK